MPVRTYEICVHGEMHGSDVLELPGLDVTRQPAQTVLRGRVPDQAALQGVLQRLHSLGLELVEVRQVSDAVGTPPTRVTPS